MQWRSISSARPSRSPGGPAASRPAETPGHKRVGRLQQTALTSPNLFRNPAALLAKLVTDGAGDSRFVRLVAMHADAAGKPARSPLAAVLWQFKQASFNPAWRAWLNTSGALDAASTCGAAAPSRATAFE